VPLAPLPRAVFTDDVFARFAAACDVGADAPFNARLTAAFFAAPAALFVPAPAPFDDPAFTAPLA